MSTNREKFLKKYGFTKSHSFGVSDIARITGISVGILQDVYKRGIGAYKTNPESVRLLDGTKNFRKSLAGKMSKEQWAISRVYSFVMKGKTFTTADADLAKKAGL